MKKLFTAIMSVALAMQCANSLELTIENQTDSTVVLAFSYLDNKQNDWVVDGWYNVNPKKTEMVNLDSKNDIYYLYSEFSNGKKLEGGKGSVNLYVDNRAFFYKQNKIPKTVQRKVSFVRARGNEGKAHIKIR
ncbi:DUF1036 domain-containing protein [Succinivibrio sp.]|uniref:DUF1036 domain-containing protein n=2 Tax=Succinivibrio sp. TaxID=2053619 RepID=UPI00386DAAEE